MHHLLAYIDPGSGSLIIQALIAGVVAIPFFFRQQIGRVVRAVRRTDSTDSSTSSTPGQTTDQAS
jgi:superfamily II DNA or RNA helicase